MTAARRVRALANNLKLVGSVHGAGAEGTLEQARQCIALQYVYYIHTMLITMIALHRAYLLGLLAMMKCSICSYQYDN